MKPSELASPIRIYWDVGGAGGISPADCRRIAEEIVANKILYLQITETSPELSHAGIAVLDVLKNKSLAISLVMSLQALTDQSVSKLKSYPLKVVFAQTNAVSDCTAAVGLLARSDAGPAIGLSFSVNRSNFQDLPRVLAFCVENRVPHLLVPMQRLTEQEACFSFSKAERIELTARLSAIEIPGWMKITIHDPFLWRAFYPSIEFPNGGCQAGNTMLYVAPNADVYACPMMPVKIGNLAESSLRDVIRGDRKKALRNTIVGLPSACRRCNDLAQCNGGCRGRAFVMTGSFELNDSACE